MGARGDLISLGRWMREARYSHPVGMYTITKFWKHSVKSGNRWSFPQVKVVF